MNKIKKYKKHLISFAMLALMILPAMSFVMVSSVKADADLWGENEDVGIDAISEEIGLSEADPRIISARIINVMLGFLGIIAVVIILLGGFRWMTAGGSEDGVAEARGLMVSGVVGLVIILSSWGLAKYIVSTLYEVTREGRIN